MLTTKSKFYYGYEVTNSNYIINFSEDGGSTELVAELEVGIYSLTDFLTEIETQLNNSGDNTYAVTVDRDTRIITIAADATFEILVSSGSSVGSSPFDLMGFTGSDRTGASSYDGDSASGSEYKPQMILQSYVFFDEDVNSSLATVNKAANGETEVVSFGTEQFLTFEIPYITENSLPKNNFMDNNQNALSEIKDFLNFCIKKGDVEFMPDRNDSDTYYECSLESTAVSRDGVGYRLRPLYNKSLFGWYETGTLKFRRVIL